MMLIDSHTHIPTDQATNPHVIRDAEESFAYLRNCGIDAAITHPWPGVYAKEPRLVEKANQDALALYDEYDGFFYPGCSIHPDFPELSVEWLARFRERGFLWVGELVPASSLEQRKWSFTDDEYMLLFEECARHGHVLQLHNKPEIADLATALPNLRIVQSHINGSEELQALAACPNTWLDISGAAGGLRIGALENACRIMGVDRLLFGSDFSGYDPRCFVTRVNAVVKDEAEREKIFSGNLLRLLADAGSASIL